MQDIAEGFLRGELSAGYGILITGSVVVVIALVLIVRGARRGQRLLVGMGSSLILFGLLALLGGVSYLGTIQGLLESVPGAFAADPARAAEEEFERMRPGVDRLYALMAFVWAPLILLGGLLFLLLRRRRPLLAGIAAGIALGSIVTLSVDVLGVTRSEPYISELVEARDAISD